MEIVKKAFLFFVVFVFFNIINAQDSTSISLQNGFRNPPNEAKARTWWHWISGHVTKKGINADLEAMKAVGIKEVQLFNVQLEFPSGPIEYLSEEWLDLFHYAALEAKRLNLEMGFHNGPGWSSSGGPWVTPENAMQTVVFCEVNLQGNQMYKGQLPKPQIKLGYYKDIAILAFPKPHMEIKIDGLDYKNLSGRIRNHLLPDIKQISKNALIQKDSIIDLSSSISQDGTLEWNVPDGEWVILRIGHTPIGKKNQPAPKSGEGLEVDKMSKKAVDAYWESGIQPIINKLGDLAGTTVINCLIDSYEVGATNWTFGFDIAFQRLSGYDLKSYLPTLAGYYVESGEVSERFLWDFRRTIGDMIAENYYAHFRDLCHKNKLKFSVEPYWGPFDNMQVGATGDIVMCEFWSGGYPFFDSPKFVSSIAHLNGSAIVGAEAFTGIGGWNVHPAQIKSIGDRAWAEGITRFIFHTYVHQPWAVAPGLALSYHGFDFNRLNTWWSQSKGFMDYIARSQFLLQQGKSVADVLVFTGESSPNTAFLFPEIKTMGHDYDLIGSNKIGELFVKNGKLYTNHSGPYEVLVLTNTNWMQPQTIQLLDKLVHDGAKIIGRQPLKSPSMQNYPSCDIEVESLASKLWRSGLIKDLTITDYLKNNTILADFKVEKGDATDINFIHRKTKDSNIYFIANASKVTKELVIRCRVFSKHPQLWNAEKGTISDLVVWNANQDGTVSIPLVLESEQSVFIVFNQNADAKKQLTQAQWKIEKSKPKPLSNLEIMKAEYGTFLQEGLIDITDLVKNEVKGSTVDFSASRQFCNCDPAMGYVKEFRMEYQIGDSIKQIVAAEKERVYVSSGDKEFKIIRALFGKFKPETKGVPKNFPIVDITEKIKRQVTSGVFTAPVNNTLIDNTVIEGDQKTLKITYLSDGEERTLFIHQGQNFNFEKDEPKPKIVHQNEKLRWITPYNGEISYTNSLGFNKKVEVKSVPKPIELNGAWEVSFPPNLGAPGKAMFRRLMSWTDAEDEGVKHFSGTASYQKTFHLSDVLLESDKSLELDLGSVFVIAEVIINGKNAGILWKAPYRLNIDGLVQKGDNKIEVKVTNLWTNKLIGDEKLPLDIKRSGRKTTEIPDWLLHNTERPTKRITFPSWNHYKKDDPLLNSGLIGPVKINISIIKELSLN